MLIPRRHPGPRAGVWLFPWAVAEGAGPGVPGQRRGRQARGDGLQRSGTPYAVSPFKGVERLNAGSP
jgi:hypothetical protein